MMWYWDSGYGSGMAAVGIFIMFLFWGGILAFVVLLVRSFAGSPADQRDAALATLRGRFAAGAITSEEYERLRKVLLS